MRPAVRLTNVTAWFHLARVAFTCAAVRCSTCSCATIARRSSACLCLSKGIPLLRMGIGQMNTKPTYCTRTSSLSYSGPMIGVGVRSALASRTAASAPATAALDARISGRLARRTE